MKPILIHHPLKRIQFSSHSEAQFSHFETTFIEHYKHLHDELSCIKNELLELKPGIDIVMSEFKFVKAAFDQLQEKITCAEVLFGIDQETEAPAEDYSIKPGEINKVLKEFQSVRHQYWSMMVPMHKQFNAVCEKFSAFDDAVEKFEKEFAGPLMRNFAIMEIDSRSFKKDMNEFRIEWMAIAGLHDTCLDEYSEWAKLQIELVKDSDVLYCRIKKLFRHIYNI
jgi:uncharacterized protein YhfF